MNKLKLFFVLLTFSKVFCAPTENKESQKINEIVGEPQKDETTNEPETTESPFDKRFNIDGDSITSQSPNQMQIPITTDAPSMTSELPAENSPVEVYQMYQDILQSQIYRTFFMLLAELQSRQLLSHSQQEVQESQVIETSMPYFTPSDCTTDDGKVIVFDENSGSYVYLDKDLLNQQDESHVSVILE